MAAEGHPVQVAVQVLEVSEFGFYAWRDRESSARRHVLLTDTIRQIYAASNSVYEVRRVHAALTLGRGMQLWHGTVAMLMSRAGRGGQGLDQDSLDIGQVEV
ncbi:transposase [Nocardiopsis changdeensis]|uniref:Transposase n=1 Tax=Nocardiopsis changdeensis TaxID=2831969 RepID=A0ABX8BW37_9ACTN|nr:MULTISPECIES: hypothetical protein [Nocardiopsis]QUX26326.1 transposase [Nocardiopsis changdeensis]QYX40631.1 hypothetical protein K1J57_07265 [Nocardiopsis sp. MT53]